MESIFFDRIQKPEGRIQRPEALVEPKITKRAIKLGNYDGYEYKVEFAGETIEGEGQLLFIVASDFEQTPIYPDLLESGLLPEDTIGHINKFFPNGKRIADEAVIENRKRKGTGSRLFSQMENDAKEKGVKALFVSTNIEEMQHFALKQGFIQLDPYRFFKIFDKKAE